MSYYIILYYTILYYIILYYIILYYIILYYILLYIIILYYIILYYIILYHIILYYIIYYCIIEGQKPAMFWRFLQGTGFHVSVDAPLRQGYDWQNWFNGSFPTELVGWETQWMDGEDHPTNLEVGKLSKKEWVTKG